MERHCSRAKHPPLAEGPMKISEDCIEFALLGRSGKENEKGGKIVHFFIEVSHRMQMVGKKKIKISIKWNIIRKNLLIGRETVPTLEGKSLKEELQCESEIKADGKGRSEEVGCAGEQVKRVGYASLTATVC